MAMQDAGGRFNLFWLRTPRRPAAVDPHRRMRVCLFGYAALLFFLWIVLVVQHQVWGEAYLAAAVRPQRRVESVVAPRGRIYSADGQVLADHRQSVALAVHYRFLEDPPDAAWLRRQARARVERRYRSDPARLQQAEQEFLQWRQLQMRRLAELCGVPVEVWRDQTAAIQSRVQRIAERVNDRAGRRLAQAEPAASASFVGRLWAKMVDAVRSAGDMPDGPPIVVAEQRQHHIVVDDLPREAVEAIQREFGNVPSIRLITRTKRFYPQGPTASHAIGYLGAMRADEIGLWNERWKRAFAAPAGSEAEEPAREQAAMADGSRNRAAGELQTDDDEAMVLRDQVEYSSDDWVGASGIERQYEIELRGRRGRHVAYPTAGGRVLAEFDAPPPVPGRDLALTIDLRLQREAEELLDAAVQRADAFEPAAPRGGAAVVLDAATGAVVAAASSPRYDPNVFLSADRSAAVRLSADPRRPLFDRATQMALPPGSAFKVVSAVALLHRRGFDPSAPLVCRGYLDRTDRWRCELYIRTGRGHGAMTLSDALTESCNVYFFHHAAEMGGGPLVDWARRFGLGQRTGIDLPAEGAGTVPPAMADDHSGPALSPTETLNLAIGQGTLTATPLQMAVAMAAVANGGKWVQPHLLAGEMLTTDAANVPGGTQAKEPSNHLSGRELPMRGPLWTAPPACPIEGIDPGALEVLRDALHRAVSDENGTAHASVYWDRVAIAGKTGTAETSAGRPPHSWFVGFVPAERPRFAFAVAIEHGGSGALAAGAVAKRLVMALHRLGMLDY